MLMNTLAIMLFTQQVFHLECLLIFQIKFQPGVAYKSVDYKKAFNVFESAKNEEITFPREFIFVFILYFIGTILLEKSCQKQGVWEEYKKGVAIWGGLSIEDGFKPSAH